MSLGERHNWCAKKILEAFKGNVENSTIQKFIRNENNLQKLNAFFKGNLMRLMFLLMFDHIFLNLLSLFLMLNVLVSI